MHFQRNYPTNAPVSFTKAFFHAPRQIIIDRITKRFFDFYMPSSCVNGHVLLAERNTITPDIRDTRSFEF